MASVAEFISSLDDSLHIKVVSSDINVRILIFYKMRKLYVKSAF